MKIQFMHDAHKEAGDQTNNKSIGHVSPQHANSRHSTAKSRKKASMDGMNYLKKNSDIKFF